MVVQLGCRRAAKGKVWRRRGEPVEKVQFFPLEPLTTQIPTGNPPAMWGIDVGAPDWLVLV